MEKPSIYDLMDQDKLDKMTHASNVIKESKRVDPEINKLLFEDLMSGTKKDAQ